MINARYIIKPRRLENRDWPKALAFKPEVGDFVSDNTGYMLEVSKVIHKEIDGSYGLLIELNGVENE